MEQKGIWRKSFLPITFLAGLSAKPQSDNISINKINYGLRNNGNVGSDRTITTSSILVNNQKTGSTRSGDRTIEGGMSPQFTFQLSVPSGESKWKISSSSSAKPSQGKESSEKTSQGVDLDKLAKAVARHETSSFTKGYGVSHNNGQGIKQGRTCPCKTKPGSTSKMCYFQSQQESNETFKCVWSKVYGGRMPTKADAVRYSGNDGASNWLKNVTNFYYN